MAGFAYPYNPEAKNDACVVVNETHNLFNTTNRWRCIIPLWAPFFHESLEVELVNKDGSITPLREGLDFYLGHYSEEVNRLTRRRVYGSIMLIQPAEGSVRFKTYETVGGAFNVRSKDIIDYLATSPLPDPRNEDWEAVMKVVRPVDPINRPVNLPEAIAKDPVTKSLKGLVDKLNALNTQEAAQFAAVFNRIKSLSTKVIDYDLTTHRFRRDGHHLTYQQLSALGKDEVAVNALRAYGRTLAELIALIKSMGIQQSNVDQYYDLLGGVFQGRLSFTDGVTCLIQNEAGTSIVDFNGGHIKILAERSVRIGVDTDANEQDVGLLSNAGNNFLSVHSDKALKSDQSAKFNGYYLIHVGNINEFMETVGDITGSKLDVNAEDSPTAFLSGKGTATKPLTGYVTFPTATDVKAGMVKIAPSLYTTADGYVASAKALLELVSTLNKYVQNTVTVMGKSLAANRTFNKTDIGLSRVDNTSPFNKPLSNAFKAAVAQKAVIGHTHTLSEGGLLEAADEDTRGVVQLTSTYVPTDNVKAVTQKLATQVQTKIAEQEAIGDRKLPSNLVHVIEYGTRNGSPLVTLNGNIVTIKAGVRYYCNTVSNIMPEWSTDLAMSYPAALQGAQAHLYVDIVGGLAKYSVGAKRPDTSTGSWLGYVTVAPAKVSVSPFVRLLNVVELDEHINSRTAHDFDTNIRKLLGLGNIENKPIVHAVNLPTFQQVFDSWYRISHGNVDRYPFTEAETLTWTYDAATGRIRNTTNSATFIGMVSLNAVGDYEFEVGLSSTNGDDDGIGIILAFYKDPITGKEHTLSLQRWLGVTNTGDADIYYDYNYSQRDGYRFRSAGSRKQFGWNAVGETIVAAKRVGNLIHCTVREFSALNPRQPIVDEYTINLESDPRFSVFLGEAKYGYCAQSQQDSTWRSIKWPEGDGRGYYASMKALRDIKAQCLDKAIILSGVVAHGAKVPLPAGFTIADVKIIAIPQTFNGHASFIKEYRCAIDPATGSVTHSGVAGDGTVITGTVRYYLVGVKS